MHQQAGGLLARVQGIGYCVSLSRSAVAMAVSVAVLLAACWPAAGAEAPARDSLSLAGPWKLRLDADDEGKAAGWTANPLATQDQIQLPSTTDLAGFGFLLDTNTMQYAAPYPTTTIFPGVKEPSKADERGFLVRRHLFVGPAWYEREVQVPESWRERWVTLRLERAMWLTEVWLDGQPVGKCDSLVAEHRYDLGRLTPGLHRLTVQVDNRMIHNISTLTHAYGPETQSRWNGLIGDLRLEAEPLVAIQSVQVFPAADRRSVRLVMVVANRTGLVTAGRLEARIKPLAGGQALGVGVRAAPFPAGSSTNDLVAEFTEPAQAWDEFNPTRYIVQVTADLVGGIRDEFTTAFGFRQIETADKGIHINGRWVFLRGTLDCCVYPRTGHAPMTVPEWERVFGVVREHGFNHVRFHTWCPPEAAFEAADRLGLYLQVEVPAWVDDWVTGTVTKPDGIGKDDEVMDYLTRELHRVLAAYGNNPSFSMLVVGNEFGQSHTDWDRVNALVASLKARDPRRLYAGCTARRHLAADDVWVTHDSGAPTRGVGPAHTDWDFAKAVAASPVPVLGHETGQRPVFPDYPALLPKFTGPLLPLNLERYRRALAATGLEGQVGDFVRASARFQLTQYKAEHEAMLRTPGYGGYQLLMLNDFTGQSEALVGVLDPFWESKGVVTAAEVRAWNAPTVPLVRMPKFVWTSAETLTAQLSLAHFGPTDLPVGRVRWTLATRAGQTVATGETEALPAPTGKVTPFGELHVPLEKIAEPTAFVLSLRHGEAGNSWNVWVYPAAPEAPEPAGVLVTTAFDQQAEAALQAGGKVLVLAHGLKNPHTTRTGFESVYWSAGWWGNAFSSLGILCDPAHPALAAFPNDGCSDWQWHDLLSGATTFRLDEVPPGFRPVVQPVPDFHYHQRLGQLFEARVDQGSLMVCGYDLAGNLDRRPGARQFRRSLFRYLASPAFHPTAELPPATVKALLEPSGLQRQGARVLRVDSEDPANPAVRVIDGDPGTFWHTAWQPQETPMPHELVIDLGRERALRGLVCLPRQDQANGRIGAAEVFLSPDATQWGAGVGILRGQDRPEAVRLSFPQPVRGRYLRLLIKSEVNGHPFASLAELELIPGEQ